MADLRLLIVAVAGIALLLALVIWRRWSAFVALLFTSFLVGLAAGMSPTKVLASVQAGMANTLGFIAIVVGLGAMFGQMLEVSGGAERLARTMLDRVGEKHAQWALMATGFLVSIPVFLDVALVILVPIVYSLGKRTNRSLLYFGVPLLAGLGVSHSMIPPTPGPAAVAEILKCNQAWVILFGVIAGVPAAMVAGPLFGTFIARHIHATEPAYMAVSRTEAEAVTPPGGAPAAATPLPGEVLDHQSAPVRPLPSFWLITFLILLPIAMIVIGTVVSGFLPQGNWLRETMTFIGHPFVALLIVTLLSFITLGTMRGYTRDEIQSIATKALEPAGIIILITGAGGVFKQVLIDSGVGQYLGDLMRGANVSLVVLGFIVAAFIRVAQGSATVAMITGAGIVSALIGDTVVSQPRLGLIAIAVACGATVLSHVNDSGFWLVNRFFGLSVKDTLKSWTVLETLVGVVGFAVVLLLSLFIR